MRLHFQFLQFVRHFASAIDCRLTTTSLSVARKKDARIKTLWLASFFVAGMLGLTVAAQGQSKNPEWHSTDPAGIPYERSVLIDPTCHVIEPPAGCSFEHTQTSLPGDNTPYDTWHVSYQAPGPVYSVHCEVFAHEHLLNETYVNNIAKCDGYINGGAARVRMTLRWKQQW